MFLNPVHVFRHTGENSRMTGISTRFDWPGHNTVLNTIDCKWTTRITLHISYIEQSLIPSLLIIYTYAALSLSTSNNSSANMILRIVRRFSSFTMFIWKFGVVDFLQNCWNWTTGLKILLKCACNVIIHFFKFI